MYTFSLDALLALLVIATGAGRARRTLFALGAISLALIMQEQGERLNSFLFGDSGWGAGDFLTGSVFASAALGIILCVDRATGLELRSGRREVSFFMATLPLFVVAAVVFASVLGFRSIPDERFLGFSFKYLNGSIMEECLFRFLLLDILEEYIGMIWAVLAVSVIFASYHGMSFREPWIFAQKMIFGIVMCFMRLRLRNAAMLSAQHFLANISLKLVGVGV